MNNSKAKVFLYILLGFGLSFIAGCGNNESQTNSITSENQSAIEMTNKVSEEQSTIEVIDSSTLQEQETISIHTHNFGELIEKENATCEKDGLEAHYICNDCGKVFDADKNETTLEDLAILKLNHDFSSSWTIDKDKHYHTCSRCGKHADEQSHTLTHHELIEATHVKDGIEEYYECDICHGMFSDEACNNQIESPIVISALGHDDILTYHEKVDPTCLEKGIEAYYSCSCGQLFADKNGQTPIDSVVEIAQLGHQNVIHHDKVDPTCETEGTIEYYECGKCHKKYLDNECKNEITGSININALGHQGIIHHERVNATCSENGIEEYYECGVCHKLFLDSLCENEIDNPEILLATGHQNIQHVVGKMSSNPNENGNIDYYYCKDCNNAWLDENQENYIGNIENNLDNIMIPYSPYLYILKGGEHLIPYYDETHQVIFNSKIEANKNIAFQMYGPKINDLNVKSVSFYLKNDSGCSTTVRICNATGATIFKTFNLSQAFGWQKVTLPVEQFNDVSYQDNYGFLISITPGMTGDSGLFNITRFEFNSPTDEEIAAANLKLESIEIIDDISNNLYVQSFIKTMNNIDEVHQLLGSSIPESLEQRDRLIQYNDYYNNYKALYNADNQLFSIDGMSSSYISGITKIVQNDTSLCKIMVSKDTSTLLFKTPDFTNSLRSSPYAIFRTYNPTNNKVALNIYDSSTINNPLYTIDVYPNSWETIMIDTALFTTARSIYIKLAAENEQSVKGDWLFTSLVHYSGNSRIIYGQNSSQKMTIYKANWQEAPRSQKDERTVFAANLVGTNTDSTAIVSLARVDQNLYDHIEFYVYNDTEYDLVMKTHMDGNNTYYNFEQTLEKDKWIKLEISVEIWNESYSRATRYFEIYPANEGDSVVGMVYFAYFYGVLK